MVYTKIRHLIQHIANTIDMIYINVGHHEEIKMAIKEVCNNSFYLRSEHMAVNHH